MDKIAETLEWPPHREPTYAHGLSDDDANNVLMKVVKILTKSVGVEHPECHRGNTISVDVDVVLRGVLCDYVTGQRVSCRKLDHAHRVVVLPVDQHRTRQNKPRRLEVSALLSEAKDCRDVPIEISDWVTRTEPTGRLAGEMKDPGYGGGKLL